MKRTISVILAVFCTAASFAQILEWHAPEIYTDIQYIGNDLFKVKRNNKFGIINKDGNISVDVKYDSITPFVENRALAISNGLLKCIIDERGRVIKEFGESYMLGNFHYSEGLLVYGKDRGDGLCIFGYLDIDGENAIEPKFMWAAPFSNGKAAVQIYNKQKTFSIIDKYGKNAIIDNRQLKFISTPVKNEVLTVAGTKGRGYKVQMERIANGRLEKVGQLPSGLYDFGISNDYKSITCCETNYYLDDAMRLISSSAGEKFATAKVYSSPHITNTSFSKNMVSGKLNILFNNKTLLHTQFKDAEFCNDKYVIVRGRTDKAGIMKLNEFGDVKIGQMPSPATFYGNHKAKGELVLEMQELNPGTKVQIGIIGLEKNGVEIKYDEISGKNTFKQEFAYFIPSAKFNSKVRLPITVNIYINGMLYKSDKHELSGTHSEDYAISMQGDNESDENGNARISFNIHSKHSLSRTAVVNISGDASVTRQLNENGNTNIQVPVNVPESGIKTFTYTVTIKDKGCSTIVRNFSKTIKHYYHEGESSN